MDVSEIGPKLAALGVQTAVIEPLAMALVIWLEERNLNALTQLALLKLVEQAVTYAEDRTEGEAFRAQAAEVQRLIAFGDRETVETLERGFS